MQKRECKVFKNRRANILTENIIFIVLNLIFLSILILFLFSRMGNAAGLEERYAKQIALIIDSAKPGMEININMEDAFNEAKENGLLEKNVVVVDNENNLVTVKLKEGKGHSYSFFNDVKVSSYYNSLTKKDYLIKEIEYKKKDVEENE